MQQQQAITYKELFAFGANPDQFEALFADVRILGYARALTEHFVERVRIFCPKREFGYMCKTMVGFGAIEQFIIHEETLFTTYHNGINMRSVMARLDLKEHEVCMSSSVYHGRAQFFGRELHDLNLVFIPAEAFILAALPENERQAMVDVLCKRYGESRLTRLCLSDVRGIAERLLGQYKVPPQLQG